MRRIARVGVGALAGVAALVLSIAAVVHAQQAQPDAAPLTEAQTAGVKRLEEVIAVLNTGDYASIRAYFEANSVRVFPVPPSAKTFSWEAGAFSQVLSRYRRSRGVDLVRVTTVTTGPSRGDVVGIIHNRITGDEDYLAVRVEPQAPHRITWLPAIEPQVVATWGLKRAASVAVTEQERLEEIRSHLKRLAEADIFSGAVVIARDGKPVFASAYGYADRQKKIPNTVDTPFLLASLTKPFTGLAIGQLVEQGKLSYNDPLSKFLPDFPDRESARKIKIKHLLSHTSGLGNPLGSKIGESIGSDMLDRQTTVKGLVETFDRKRPEFEPGAKWSYSNTGFVLLGRIIEIVTGQDYYDYMQKNVFGPAGAASASFPLLPRNGVAVVPMAYPYEQAWDEEHVRPYVENKLGKEFRRGSPAGNAIVSALDLIKLANAMNAGQIVKPETLRLHTSPKPELNTNYGYGFFTRHYGGRPLVGHGGNAWGMCTQFGELRDTPYTIVVLSNLTIDACMEVNDRILRVLRPSEEKFALGVSLEQHPEGALVASVLPDGTAAAMGVRVGDIIVELDGKPMSPQVVQEYLQKTKIGDRVTMKVKRTGAIMELIGKAMARPA
jgi:CubicO group peptidase (beta-lactamase class C family)